MPHQSSYSSLSRSAAEGCSVCRDVEELVTGDDARNALDSPLSDRALTCFIAYRSSNLGPWTLFVQFESIIAPGLGETTRSDITMYYSVRPVASTDSSWDTERSGSPMAFSDSTGSHQTMSLIQSWLDTCIRTHESCNKGREDAWIPTRLLELSGSPGNPKIRMRSRFQDEYTRYFTLSHRWGPAGTQPFKFDCGVIRRFSNGR